jgi:hypothetical protein
MRVIAMRPVWFFALATSLVLALHPAQAQMSPSLPRAANAPANAPGATAPAGTLVAPPSATATADAVSPATAGIAPPASASVSPGAAGAGGICQCLTGYGTGTSTRTAQPYENNVLGLRCTAAVDDCKSACQTQNNFAFVPNAVFSCHGTPPAESTGKVALNLPRRYPATRR